MLQLNELKNIFDDYLFKLDLKKDPNSLYDPIDYIMGMGGKRIRPLLMMAAFNLYDDEFDKCLSPAVGIEMFHNFTLVHDDIMDDAPLRRGKETVHEKWDQETGILSGDAMLIKAYEYYNHLDANLYKKVMMLFIRTSLQLCEGQRLDMDFEVRDEVSIDDYLKMIEYKTAVLISCALEIGGLIGGADEEDAQHLYEFGRNAGIAFQIQDDLLDVFGDDPKVGKQKAGDIIQNKKTYLYLKSLELLSMEKSNELRSIFRGDIELNNTDKINKVTAHFKTAQVHIYAEELKEAYLQLALSHLDAVKVDASKKFILSDFAKYLLERKF